MSVATMITFGVVALGLVLMFNSLVSKMNEIENAAGGVHTFLKKRADLIPSLVATVKQYAAHETKLLTDLTVARTAAQSRPTKDGELQQGDAMISQALGRAIAVAENYPNLKANENFLSLQASLNEVEDQLSAARRTYNAAVVRYNNAVESIYSALPVLFLQRPSSSSRTRFSSPRSRLILTTALRRPHNER